MQTIELEEVRFPRTEEREGLLRAEPFDAVPEAVTSFLDAEGQHVIALHTEQLRRSKLVLRDAAGSTLRRVDVPLFIEELATWTLGDRTQLLVARGAEKQFTMEDRIVVYSTEGDVLWSYIGAERIDVMRTFRTANDEPRIALHEGNSLVILRPDGSVVTKDLKQIGAYSLLSHPAFPGSLFVTFFGRFDEYYIGAKDAVKRLPQIDVSSYPTDAVLVSDAIGDPVFVYNCNDDASVPTIECTTLTGIVLWSATIGDSVLCLQTVTLPNGRDVLVTVERSGSVSVFDTEGTLFGRLDIQTVNPDQASGEFMVFGAVMCATGPTTQRIFVQTNAGDAQVDIDLSTLLP